MALLQIVQYNDSLKSCFRSLNHEWLSRFFFVTEEDDKILSSPEKIIQEGGCILFAQVAGEIVGTCALIKVTDTEFEVAKMAVTEKEQGKKTGRALLEAVIQEALRKKAELLSLETALSLKAAISLYERAGFIRVSDERIHPLFGRKTFRMEKSLK